MKYPDFADCRIRRTARLTAAEKSALMSLSLTCMKADGSRVSYPLEEPDGIHYLFYKEGHGLISALAFLPCGVLTAECIAYTAPAFRRRGSFSALLGAVLSDREDWSLLFPVSGTAADARAVLAVIGAGHDHDELQMCLELFPAAGVHAGSRKLPHSRTPHASFALTPVSADTLCLHDVAVEEGFRGRGLAGAMIGEMLRELRGYPFRRVILHVSGGNAPAVALYKKAGFRITETLSYFLY